MSQSETVSGSREAESQPEGNARTGLDFFSPQTTAEERRRYWIHFFVYVGLLSLTVWPVFTLFNRVTPYVLGLPFNMAWNTFVLVLVAVNTYLLYRFEENEPLFAGEGGGTESGGEA